VGLEGEIRRRGDCSKAVHPDTVQGFISQNSTNVLRLRAY
jgi:hypothetical protein